MPAAMRMRMSLTLVLEPQERPGSGDICQLTGENGKIPIFFFFQASTEAG